MLIYLILGALFIGFIDVLASINPNTDTQFNNWERIAAILLWPVLFIIFIYNMFKNIR
jgi:uncharacterized membrane protein YhdT